MCNPVRIVLSLVLFLMGSAGFTQVNSPYSRFGIGDLYDGRNMTSKAMGGLSTPYTDIQSVNFNNPASYTGIGFVTFDLGIETEFRTLTNQEKTQRFESGNMIVNYAAMGIPLMKDKKREKTLWAMAFGLRPLSRIRYNIVTPGRTPGIDSMLTEFRGDGGLYRAFLGTGFRLGNLSLGVNAGYVFGQRKISTYRTLVNDSVFYFTGALDQEISISDFAVDAGLQYEIKPTKKSTIRIGATGFLGRDIKAERNRFSQTVFFNNFGNADTIDVVANDFTKGKISLPGGYSLGVAFETAKNLMIGAEYETTMWSELGNFGQMDGMGDTRRLRLGGQIIPDVMSSRNYWKQVMYRAGVFTGKDYVVIDGHQLPVWGVTFGGGIPIRRYNAYSTQFNTINLSFEYGRRGNGQSPYVERYFRVGLGLSLSDVWFIKRQYD
jgi:hypothetical protein